MTPEMVIDIGYQSLKTALILAAPLLAAGIFIGLVISILQAVTSIQDMTLTFAPKILVIMIVLMFCFPWMLNVMETFTKEIFLKFPLMAR